MAWNLAHSPNSGPHVVMNGDAHFNNFGLFGTPQRDVVIDLNDFDEVTIGPWGWAEPRPFVLQRSLGDFAVNDELNVYCDDAQRMMPLYAALHCNILDAFNEYSVQIMTPAYETDPVQAKVVPKEQGHAAPAAPSGSERFSAPPEAAGEERPGTNGGLARARGHGGALFDCSPLPAVIAGN